MIGASVVGASGAYADAEITSGANIDAIVGSDATLNSSGAIDIEALTADSSGNPVQNTASATITSVSLSFAASISVMVADSSIGGAVDAELNGTVTGSSQITVNANGTNNSTASVDTTSASFGLGLSGSGAEADITSDAKTNATAGSASSLRSNGAIAFTATSKNTANASSTAGTGALFAFSLNIPKADIGAPTTAEVDGGVTGASSLSVTANSHNNSSSSANPVGFGLFTGAGAHSEADIESSAATSANAGSGTISVTGKIALTANGNNTATASTDGTGAGGLSVSVLDSYANDHAGTDAAFGATVNQATEIDVNANGSDNATGTLHAISIGLLAGVTVSTGNSTIDGSNSASLSSTAKIQSPGTNVSVKDTHVGEADASANGGAGGALGAAVLTANGTDSPTVNAFADSGATVGNSNGTPGSLTISADSTEGTSVNANAGTGGIVSFGGIGANSTVSPSVNAYLGTSDHVNVTGDVTVTSTLEHAEGHTRATAYGGGAAQIGAASADATVNPTVIAYAGSGANVQAGGNVTIDAENLSNQLGTPLGDTFTSPTDVNQSTGTVEFDSHGLTTGDAVLYEAGGNPLPGLRQNCSGVADGGCLYTVVAVDANHLQFGDVFATGSIDASAIPGFCNTTTDPNSCPGVDPNRSFIRFAQPDNFATGDPVILSAAPGSSLGAIGAPTGDDAVRARDRPLHDRAVHDLGGRDGHPGDLQQRHQQRDRRRDQRRKLVHERGAGHL